MADKHLNKIFFVAWKKQNQAPPGCRTRPAGSQNQAPPGSRTRPVGSQNQARFPSADPAERLLSAVDPALNLAPPGSASAWVPVPGLLFCFQQAQMDQSSRGSLAATGLTAALSVGGRLQRLTSDPSGKECGSSFIQDREQRQAGGPAAAVAPAPSVLMQPQHLPFCSEPPAAVCLLACGRHDDAEPRSDL